jgi:hypothetical protein
MAIVQSSRRCSCAPRKADPIKLGDWVKIVSPPCGLTGRVVEFRGPLGPKGVKVYRFQLRRKPKPAYFEVVKEQLETIPSSS